mmetsp:Transcript_85953/g.243794  ORF Transcript_85953/g.243794 Transcript_85953/m.243794 type:complete len:209 (+) Transcript_85953:67-693(+)
MACARVPRPPGGSRASSIATTLRAETSSSALFATHRALASDESGRASEASLPWPGDPLQKTRPPSRIARHTTFSPKRALLTSASACRQTRAWRGPFLSAVSGQTSSCAGLLHHTLKMTSGTSLLVQCSFDSWGPRAAASFPPRARRRASGTPAKSRATRCWGTGPCPTATTRTAGRPWECGPFRRPFAFWLWATPWGWRAVMPPGSEE